ncbi:MAG: pyridoxal-phosphate dependent enzyme [Epsilonproteobacteria bacterium]|nr:pyridoxal-phosphate dependent enzyme [Campylobacterota bacterium]
MRVRGRLFYVKRDDLIHPYFSGNKFRKLQALIRLPASRYRRLVSYGGVQSNAMLSMAALARMKGWRFLYAVKAVPRTVREADGGNFAAATALGMEVTELGYEGFYEKVENLKNSLGSKDLFIPQGGADPVAEEGVKTLAGEITTWKKAAGHTHLDVVTPSGTGTTALYLRRHLPSDIEVLTVPVVGDAQTLLAQWRRLASVDEPLPRILEAETKWPFAKPHPDFLMIWRELEKAGITFDLIYAPKTWRALFLEYEKTDRSLLYVHSGGIYGNKTQLLRYMNEKALS